MADQLIKVKNLLDDSGLTKVKNTRTVTFPKYYIISDIVKGVKELLNLELMTHNPSLDGIVIAHENVEILVASVVSDLCDVTFDVSADYFVFRPRLGSKFQGVVNKANRDYIGCLVYDCINVLLLKRHDQNWDSRHIKVGDSVSFEVTRLDHLGKLLLIIGKLLEVKEKENDGQHLEDDGYGSKNASATLLPMTDNLQKFENFKINKKTMSEEGKKKYFDLEEESVNDTANCSLNEKCKPCVKRSTIDVVDGEKGSSSVKSDRIKKDDSSRKDAKASKTKDKSKRLKDKSSKRGEYEVTESKDRKTTKGKSKVKLISDGDVELESSKRKKVKAE